MSSDLLLQTWQRVWRRGCRNVERIVTVWDGRKNSQSHISKALCSHQRRQLSGIISKYMLPSNKISLGTVLPSNIHSLWGKTNKQTKKKQLNHWFEEVTGITDPARVLPSNGATCIFCLNTIYVLRSRCGDVITSHSSHHRAMQRTHSLVLERKGLQLQSCFTVLQLFENLILTLP